MLRCAAASAGSGVSAQTVQATVQPVLTRRLQAVLTGISYGHSNAQIGERMGITEATVKSHIKRLFRVLRVRDRAHAVRAGFETGLLCARPVRAHPQAVPGRPVPPPGLNPLLPRDAEFTDSHIGACFAAEACPCRHKYRKQAHDRP